VSPRARQISCVIVLLGFGAFLVWGVLGLQDFGHWTGLYGRRILKVASSERQVTNVVSAVNFDYRMFDTLIEELILFTSVMGVMLVLRHQRGEDPEPEHAAGDSEGFEDTTDGVRVLGVILIGVTLLLGLYIVVHGHLTPGGGFQGGVILGAAVLLVYFAGDFVSLRQLEPSTAMELMHSGGAAGLAMIGLGGLLSGAQAFHNFLYTGTTGELISGGFIPLGNAAVGLEVFGAVLLLGAELLHEAALLRR
jgi:multicomponent Na+:H+ antiporter subunit B